MRFDAAWSYAGRTGTVRDIDVAWTERWATSGPADLRRVTLSLPIPADIGVPTLVASGVPLSSMHVALTATSDTGDSRVVLSGYLRASSYGAAGEPVEGELGDIEADDLGTVPPFLIDGARASTVDATSWPSSPDAARGSVYPWPFGVTGNVPATPAIVVDVTDGAEVLLVSGNPVAATACTIWGPSYFGSETYSSASMTVTTAVDGYGHPVAVVSAATFGQVGKPAWDPTAKYFASWSTDAVPGRLDQFASALLNLSSLDVDNTAQSAASAPLSRYRVAGYLDSGQAPSELLGAVVAQVPAVLTRGDTGLYVAPAAGGLDSATVETTITVGRDAHEQGPVRLVMDEPVARVRVEYAWDAQAQKYTASVDVLGAPKGRTVEMSLGQVYDRVTAEAMATQLLADGHRWREVALVVEEDRYGWGGPRELRTGQVVQLVDARRVINARARIVAIERDRGGMRVTLRLRG
jgi:hypothetical protein